MRDEENLSAEQSKKKKDSRLQDAHEVSGGPPRDQTSAREGPQAPRPLSQSSRETFPPSARLRKRREFLEVYDKGVRVRGSLVVMFVRPTSLGRARLGVTATRKLGGAVTRNRMRRLVREAFRRNRHGMQSWDLVVNLTVRARDQRYRGIESELMTLIRRAERKLGVRPGSRRR